MRFLLIMISIQAMAIDCCASQAKQTYRGTDRPRISLSDDTKKKMIGAILDNATLSKLIVNQRKASAPNYASSLVTGHANYRTREEAEDDGYRFSKQNSFEKNEVVAVRLESGGYGYGLYLGFDVTGMYGPEQIKNIHVVQPGPARVKGVLPENLGKHKSFLKEIKFPPISKPKSVQSKPKK